MAGPLDGIRVLEFSQVIAAPFAGQILADLGADVLKVEPPGGESWRLQVMFAPTESKAYQCLNRGKRCMTLQLDTPAARDIVHQLVREMDAVLINYRPDAPAKFGIDYDSLSAIKPDLVYVDLTAFGRRGEWANRPGYDGAVQAVSGLMAAEGKTRPGEGSPTPISSSAIADYGSGYVLADALISGLYHREMTGEGQFIECSLLATALNLQPDVVMEHPVADTDVRNPARARRRTRASEGAQYTELLEIRDPEPADNIYHRAYLTADGGIVIAAETSDHIAAVFAYFDLDRRTLAPGDIWALEQHIEAGNTRNWLSDLGAAGIPVAPINFPEEMNQHPQVQESGWTVDLVHETTGAQRQITLPLDFSLSTVATIQASPPLGRDTDAVLADLGYSDSDIDSLRSRGVIQ